MGILKDELKISQVVRRGDCRWLKPRWRRRGIDKGCQTRRRVEPVTEADRRPKIWWGGYGGG